MSSCDARASACGAIAGIAERIARGVRLGPPGRRRGTADGDAAGTARRIERIRTRVEHELDTRSARLGAWLLRTTGGRIARLWRRRALVLTARGRRSGLKRAVPLQYFEDGEDMIVVAANSGMPSPPAWYLNLRADPRAWVDVGGRTLEVRAEELSADEAAAFWPRVLRVAPDYARYPERTTRRIAMLRLVPAARAGVLSGARPSPP